ncbi:protein NEDD1 [Syngnathoides biaculeatus]|uniref:protein NEDD1 n=1 Tax=Syngnathoides biaculeatus TaxID=300417 RepID=UPI002ADDA45D|nr:protein NEDD1 [Syngnathoides biaculeatus]XP_061696610.1 protein NEDD1 [Syngnathoides biaculeatus]XP_061696611.1 protein NEDD1 [Syngnathoides biaculeatus]
MDDGHNRLASAGDVVKIWDADSMTLLEQFNPHGGHRVAQVCWTSNNQHVVSAGCGGDKLAVTSLKSPHATLLELAHGKRQTRVSLSWSSQLLASGGLDRCVHIWDLKSARLLRSLKDHTDEVTCVAFNSNDSLVASGSAGGHLLLYSLTTNTACKPFGPGGQRPVRDLAASRLKRSLLGSVSDDGSLSLWDANAQKELHVFRGAHKAPGSGVAFSPANELLLVSVGLDKKIVCYDAASKITLLTIRTESPLTSVDFTPDGSGLLAGSAQGRIFRYDLRNNSAPAGVTSAHDTPVTCLRFRCAAPRHKSGKTSSCRVSGTKSSACKLSGGHPGPAPAASRVNAGGAGARVADGDAAGQEGAEPLPAVGRNSLDMFSPLRQGAGSPSDETFAAARATLPSEEAGLPQLTGRSSLDMFSPLRESRATGDCGAPGTASAGRAFRPRSAFRTPSIREEEPDAAVDPAEASRGVSPGPERRGQTPPTDRRPSPPFALELSPRGQDDVGAQLDRDSDSAATAPGPSPVVDVSPAVSAGGARAPFSSVQLDIITDIIREQLDELRDACHKDIINLQVEMVRQFCIQLNEFHALMSAHLAAREALLRENERLKEENLRLKTNY